MKKLKVWTGSYRGDRNAIVAAYSQKQAIELLGESRDGFKNYYWQTDNPEILQLATETGLWIAVDKGITCKEYEKKK